MTTMSGTYMAVGNDDRSRGRIQAWYLTGVGDQARRTTPSTAPLGRRLTVTLPRGAAYYSTAARHGAARFGNLVTGFRWRDSAAIQWGPYNRARYDPRAAEGSAGRG